MVLAMVFLAMPKLTLKTKNRSNIKDIHYIYIILLARSLDLNFQNLHKFSQFSQFLKIA